MIAPVAQLDRVIGYEPIGQGFESLRVRHFFSALEIYLETDVLGKYPQANTLSIIFFFLYLKMSINVLK